MFFLIAASGMFYLAGSNNLTAKGFELRDLKKQDKAVVSENADLETRVTALSSYNDLGEKVKTLGMVSIDKINYIEIKNESVAIK